MLSNVISISFRILYYDTQFKTQFYLFQIKDQKTKENSKEKRSFLVNINKMIEFQFYSKWKLRFLECYWIFWHYFHLCLSLFQEAIKRCSKRKQMKKELLPWKFNFISSYASFSFSSAFYMSLVVRLITETPRNKMQCDFCKLTMFGLFVAKTLNIKR